MKNNSLIPFIFIFTIILTGCTLPDFQIIKPKMKNPYACSSHVDCKPDPDNFYFCSNPNTTKAKCVVQKCIVKDDCEKICKEWTLDQVGNISLCKFRRVKCKSDNTCVCSCLAKSADMQ